MPQAKQNAMLFLFEFCVNSQNGPKEGVPVATDHSIANAQSKISSFPSCHQRFGDASAENPNSTQCPNSALTVPGTKIRSARRTVISEGGPLGGASCFLRIFGHCVFLYRALLVALCKTHVFAGCHRFHALGN